MAELNPYTKSSVTTATAMELVLMVYDECIRSLDKAEEAFALEGPESIEQIGNHLRHAKDSITELSLSLDMDSGGEIAMNLYRVYDFMVNHLTEANVKKQLKPVLEVRDMMVELREAWYEVRSQEATHQENNPPPAPGEVGRIRIAG